MNARMYSAVVCVLAGTLLPVSPGLSAVNEKLTGGITGLVRDAGGIPQMGATVLLYDRFDRILKRVLTSDKGTFGFASLPAETYTIRVSLSAFLPALKRNISVQPGMQSLLNVHLASALSSIELVSVSPGQSSVMSDEWRWVLRASTATRPVMRVLTEANKPNSRKQQPQTVFKDTRGVVKVTGGDQGGVSGLGSESDLGTAFALATSFLGSNELKFSGNFGYSSATGAPAAGFRTSFRRAAAPGVGSPEVKLTMRQLSLPTRLASAALSDAPMLRTLSATMLDAQQLTDHVLFEYGTSIDSVTFMDRLNYVSPYGRLTYERTPGETFQLGYASGTPPAEAFLRQGESDLQFQQDLSALALFPRVSLRGNHVRVQRTQTMEAGYRKTIGSRTYAAAVYRDDISNGAVTMSGTGFDGAPMGRDLLPDLFTDSWTLNVGRFHSQGYMASVTQALGSRFEVAATFGSGGALVVDPRQSGANGVEDLRSMIRSDRRYSLTARVGGTLPESGTQFDMSYQWVNVDALNAAHMFLTQSAREGQGLNIRIRQPLPYFNGLPGHLEATAEMRNLLAQGYAPILYGQRRTYLMQTARSVRGGLSFIF